MTKWADFLLPVALLLATVGMALITFGVVEYWLFFPGVYLLAIGLITTAVAALLRWFGPRAT